MKIFKDSKDELWGTKVNFVDENNVVVGFNTDQDCCENFGYFFSDHISDKTDFEKVPDLSSFPECVFEEENYIFDSGFFKKDSLGNTFEDGGAVVFKLIHKEMNVDRPIYLVLSNSHNGYYCHGFKMDVEGSVIQEGSI